MLLLCVVVAGVLADVSRARVGCVSLVLFCRSRLTDDNLLYMRTSKTGVKHGTHPKLSHRGIEPQ